MKKWLRYLNITFLSLFTIVLLFAGASAYIAYFYEDELVKYALKELQKQIDTDVHIEEVDLTLIKSFPKASLVFYDISAREAGKHKENIDLFKFQRVALSFNVMDIFHKRYAIRHVSLENGFAQIKLFTDGTDNYHFWKVPTDSTSSGKFNFNLKKVELIKVSFAYNDYKSKTSLHTYIHDVELKGKLNDERFDLAVDAQIDLNKMEVRKTSYPIQKNVNLDLLLDIYKNEQFIVKKGNVILASQEFDLKGKVHALKDKLRVDLYIKGKDLNPDKIITYLPRQYQSYWKPYDINGKIYFDARIKGFYGGNQLPYVKANFGIVDGKINREDASLKIENIQFKGAFSNGRKACSQSSVLDVYRFSCQFGGSKIDAKGRIINFDKPSILLRAKAKVVLPELLELFPIDTLDRTEGVANIDIRFATRLHSFGSFHVKDFISSKTSGNMHLKDVALQIRNDAHAYEGIQGTIYFTNNDIAIHSLAFRKASSDFNIEGKAKNFLSYIFMDNQKLYVEARVKSKNLNLDELLASGKSSAEAKTYHFSISEDLDFNVNLSVGEVNFRRFQAGDVQTRLVMKDQICVADNLCVRTMKGNIICRGSLNAKDAKQMRLMCEVDCKEVDMRELFYQFENFGQRNLISSHLKGRLNSKLQFTSVLNEQLDIDLKKTEALADLNIQDGELINYAPMQALSRFVALEELKHIKFSQLKNSIQIKEGKIIIPKMEIKSNALNIGIAGTHSFNNEIDYKLELLLSDILYKKTKTRRDNSEFGEIQDDGMGKSKLFIKVYGTIDNPQFAYDKSGLKQKIQTDIQKEKQTLKQILNEEFGLFKKDSLKFKSSSVNQDERKEDKPKRKKTHADEEIEDGIQIEW